MNCRGDEDIDAKRSRPSIGKPVTGHARKERVLLFGTDQRITSGPAAKRLHSKAEYMTAPERFAESQILFPCTAGALHTWPTREDSYLEACVSAVWGTSDATTHKHARGRRKLTIHRFQAYFRL